MRTKLGMLFLFTCILTLTTGIAGVWAADTTYALYGEKSEPNFKISRDAVWSGQSENRSINLEVVDAELWNRGTYDVKSRSFGVMHVLSGTENRHPDIVSVHKSAGRTGMSFKTPYGLIGNIYSDRPSDVVLAATTDYVLSAAGLGDWTGVKVGWWSSSTNEIDSIKRAGLSEVPQTPNPAPEAATLIGFGAALALNGIGAAGSKYYLKRRYSRDSARSGAASRRANKMALYMDTAVSVTLLVVVSPLLAVVAAGSALKSGKPVVFK